MAWTRKTTDVVRDVKDDPEPPPARVPTPLDGVVLPPYTGKDTRCVKCNGRKAKTQYLWERMICTHVKQSCVHGQERMHRTCKTCGWSWDEAVYQPEEDDDHERQPVGGAGERMGRG